MINISDIIKKPMMNCEYIAVHYDYTAYIITNFVLSIAIFINRWYSKKVKYDYERADKILKLILAVYNTNMMLLHLLSEPLQVIILSMM